MTMAKSNFAVVLKKSESATIINTFKVLSVLLIAIISFSCSNPNDNEVVIYTSLDQIYSEPILKEFEEKTGIKVKPVYDVEAAKTTGLVNKIIAEKGNPQADVFWNNEVIRTIILKNKGLLQPYNSPSSQNIPNQYKDPEGYWTGFAARARVLIVNTDLVSRIEFPASIFELTSQKWKGEVALANPLFGTTSAHVAAIFNEIGEDSARAYFKALKENEIVLVPGNSTSRDMVQDGELMIGFTDTDDANMAIRNNKPVAMLFPDKLGFGTLVIPNTIALIRGSKNPEEGKMLIDYILSEEVESTLAHSLSAQIPLRPGVNKPQGSISLDSLKSMTINYEDLTVKFENSTKFVHELFIR